MDNLEQRNLLEKSCFKVLFLKKTTKLEQQCLSTFSVKGYTSKEWDIYDYEMTKKILKRELIQKFTKL
jgi:UDP-galactopyranose mutase